MFVLQVSIINLESACLVNLAPSTVNRVNSVFHSVWILIRTGIIITAPARIAISISRDFVKDAAVELFGTDFSV